MSQLYDAIGINYANHRRPDPRIAAAIDDALGDAEHVLNVGAGTGSYEPAGRAVVAVEPSRVMIDQRPGGAAPVLRASASMLPFGTDSFDAATALMTIHHWRDVDGGLRGLCRVARDRVVIFTHEVLAGRFWLHDYLPELLDRAQEGFPTQERIEAALGSIDEYPVPIPGDCQDGFLCAYWRRPEAYLDSDVRAAISAFVKFGGGALAGLDRLRDDLASGAWQREHADLLRSNEIDSATASSSRQNDRPRARPSGRNALANQRRRGGRWPK